MCVETPRNRGRKQKGNHRNSYIPSFLNGLSQIILPKFAVYVFKRLFINSGSINHRDILSLSYLLLANPINFVLFREKYSYGNNATKYITRGITSVSRILCSNLPFIYRMTWTSTFANQRQVKECYVYWEIRFGVATHFMQAIFKFFSTSRFWNIF